MRPDAQTLDREYLLPWPPSVNHYWETIRRRGRRAKILSEAAKNFRAAVVDRVLKSHGNRFPCPIVGRLDVTLIYHWPDRRTRDTDNYLKGVFDGLTHARVWHDDHQVRNHHVLDGEIVPGGCIRVRIRQCDSGPVPLVAID